MDRRKFLKIGLKSLFILPFIKPLITMVKPKPVRAYWAGNLVCSNPKLRNLGFWDAKSNKTHQHFT